METGELVGALAQIAFFLNKPTGRSLLGLPSAGNLLLPMSSLLFLRRFLPLLSLLSLMPLLNPPPLFSKPLSLSFFSRALLYYYNYYYYNYYYYNYYYYYLEGDARGSYGRITGKAFAMLYMRDCVVNF